MPEYRRNRVPGGTFFFTVNLRDRDSDLLVRHVEMLREAVRRVRHMHCLWTLPPGDADFPGRWRAIKIAFAKSLPEGEPRTPVMTRRGERGIWQRRYWEHTIRDEPDFSAHMDYTHFNPVKHGFVDHPADWPHSSFRRCVASGFYPTGWSGGSAEPQNTGERW